ncbi:hypothetical protein Tco_0194071 [Tanacetum coccineum]
MANLSEDIQCAGSDTRPPMLDRTDFLHPWQTNEFVCIVDRKSNSNQSLPNANDLWDNVEAAYGRNIKMTDVRMQRTQVFVTTCCQNEGRHNKGQGNNARGAATAGYGGAQNRVGNANPGQARQENGVALDEEQLLFIAGGQDNAIDKRCSYPVYDKVGPSYDLNILSELHDYDQYQDVVCKHYEEHEMHDGCTTKLQDSLEIAEITKRKMNDKMKDPECVTHKVKIDHCITRKFNYLATFTPQKQLTPEQIFWSQDLIKMKEKALKEHTTASRPFKALMVYPPNTPAMLVLRVLPTKSQNSELTVSRFTEMREAHTIVQTRCLELEAELSKLRDKV